MTEYKHAEDTVRIQIEVISLVQDVDPAALEGQRLGGGKLGEVGPLTPSSSNGGHRSHTLQPLQDLRIAYVAGMADRLRTPQSAQDTRSQKAVCIRNNTQEPHLSDFSPKNPILAESQPEPPRVCRRPCRVLGFVEAQNWTPLP